MAQCRFGRILDWSAGGISGTSGVGGLAGWGWKELARLAGAAEIKGITLEGQALTEEKGNYRRGLKGVHAQDISCLADHGMKKSRSGAPCSRSKVAF